MTIKGLELRGNPDHRFKFNGIERVENFKLNWDMALYRSYDQVLGLWGQSDPKYNYSQSVYLGFGNNPLKYVDPLGDTILIRHQGEPIFYMNNQLYWANNEQKWQKYDGKAVKKKGKNAGKLKGFVKNLFDALNKIDGGGEHGDNLISTLENSSNYVTVKEDSNQNKGLFVSWDPYDRDGGIDEKGSTMRPAFIGLAHELAHAMDWLNGDIDRKEWFKLSNKKVINNAEGDASIIENNIRREHNLPLRTHYSIDQGKPIGSLLDYKNLKTNIQKTY